MRLKEIRKLKGYTQNDVSKHLGITQASYSGYESEKFEPTIATLKQLAQLFDCTIDELVGNEKKTSIKTNPEKEELLRTIDRLTEIECHKLNVFAEGLITNRVAEQKQRTNNLINIITKED